MTTSTRMSVDPTTTTGQFLAAESSIKKAAATYASCVAQPVSAAESGRRVVRRRCWFIASLCIAAGFVGWLVHFFIRSAETDLARRQFEALTDRALDESVSIFKQKRLALVTMSSMISQLHPNMEDYPFVYVPGFEEIATELLKATSGVDMGFTPIVPVDQLAEWEDFAYNYYFNIRDPPFPNGTGASSFGWGVWGVDFSMENSTDKRYHESESGTNYNSPYPDIKAVCFQLDDGVNMILMQNMHHRELLGRSFDGVLDCVKEQTAKGTLELQTCGSATIMFDAWKFQERGPASAIYQPIFPRNSPDTVVGFTGSSIVFDVIMENVFAETVNGVDVVLSNERQTYTYKVVDGAIHAIGYGDLRAGLSVFDGSCVSLTQGEDLWLGKNNSDYELCLFPNSEFLDGYSTNNPWSATAFAVAIFMLMALFFFLYDFAVRGEFHIRKELLAAKRAYMRFVSHEVRTPLNAVCMGLTIIRTEIANSLGNKTIEELDHANLSVGPKEGTPAEWFQLAGEVNSSAMDAIQILSDLLNWDKIQSGELELEMSVISLQSLVERTAGQFKLPATKKSLDLALPHTYTFEEKMDKERGILEEELDMESEAAHNMRVIGDAARLALVLRNLLSNAIKFTEEGGNISVTTSWCRRGDEGSKKSFELKNGAVVAYPECGQLYLRVKDSGAGMTSSQLSRLFGEFVQFNVNDLQAGNGSGLGLLISKGIVEQHNGTLTAQSDGLGMGTTFTVALPLYLVPASDDPEIQSTAASENTPNPLDLPEIESRAMHILIVDDVATNRKLLGRLLKNRGHSYDEAEDGEIALEKTAFAEQEGISYDTILLDYEMPRLKGPDTARIIREQGNSVFIVGVTGNLLQEDVDYFKSCGADEVLAKPLSFSALEEVWRKKGVYAGVRGGNIKEAHNSTTVGMSLGQGNQVAPLMEQHLGTNADRVGAPQKEPISCAPAAA